MMNHFVVFGLGNPGKKYERTRHNIGFLIAEALAKKCKASFRLTTKFHAEVATAEIEGCRFDILKPVTYMNESGQAIAAFVQFYKVPMNHIIVVVDDVAIPFGTMRLRVKGSAGGHNGLKSVEEALHSANYPRLRIGVGERGEKELVDHVLGEFNREEQKELEQHIEKAALGLLHIPTVGFQRVASIFNERSKE